MVTAGVATGEDGWEGRRREGGRKEGREKREGGGWMQRVGREEREKEERGERGERGGREETEGGSHFECLTIYSM